MLDGHYKRVKHDSSMLDDSKLLAKLNSHSYTSHGEPRCSCSDPFYRLNVHLQVPFQNDAIRLTPNRVAEKIMSQVRSSV